MSYTNELPQCHFTGSLQGIPFWIDRDEKRRLMTVPCYEGNSAVREERLQRREQALLIRGEQNAIDTARRIAAQLNLIIEVRAVDCTEEIDRQRNYLATYYPESGGRNTAIPDADWWLSGSKCGPLVFTAPA